MFDKYFAFIAKKFCGETTKKNKYLLQFTTPIFANRIYCYGIELANFFLSLLEQ